MVNEPVFGFGVAPGDAGAASVPEGGVPRSALNGVPPSASQEMNDARSGNADRQGACVICAELKPIVETTPAITAKGTLIRCRCFVCNRASVRVSRVLAALAGGSSVPEDGRQFLIKNAEGSMDNA